MCEINCREEKQAGKGQEKPVKESKVADQMPSAEVMSETVATAESTAASAATAIAESESESRYSVPGAEGCRSDLQEEVPTSEGERVLSKDEHEALKDEYALLCKENKELSQMLMRLRADFDNYRRRVQAEKTQAGEQVLFDFAKKLLPVIDNLDRALNAAYNGSENSSLLEGVAMTLKQFLQVMQEAEVKPIETNGCLFDPNLHEAIGHEAIGHEKENELSLPVVVEELEKGYTLKGRVLRASKVKISC